MLKNQFAIGSRQPPTLMDHISLLVRCDGEDGKGYSPKLARENLSCRKFELTKVQRRDENLFRQSICHNFLLYAL